MTTARKPKAKRQYFLRNPLANRMIRKYFLSTVREMPMGTGLDPNSVTQTALLYQCDPAQARAFLAAYYHDDLPRYWH